MGRASTQVAHSPICAVCYRGHCRRDKERALHWRLKAACLDADPDIFFPEMGRTYDTVLAKRICDRCEVTKECLDYALANNFTDGVWGGKTCNEREPFERGRAEPVRSDIRRMFG